MAPNGVWSPLKNAAPAQNTPSWSSSSSNQVALLAHHLQLALERRGAGDGVGRAARQADALDDGIDLADSQHGEDRLVQVQRMLQAAYAVSIVDGVLPARPVYTWSISLAWF